jgi:hypothetical protein
MSSGRPHCGRSLLAMSPRNHRRASVRQNTSMSSQLRSKPRRQSSATVSMRSSANRIRRFSSVSSCSTTLPTPVCDMTTPPWSCTGLWQHPRHAVQAAPRPMPRCTRGSPASAHETVLGTLRLRSSLGELKPRTCRLSVAGGKGVIADCALAHAMREHTQFRSCRTAECQPSCGTRAAEPGWLRFCQRQQRRSRSGVGQVQRSIMVSRWRIR